MKTLGPQLDRRADCEAILRSLPLWFGIEDALQMYVADTTTLPSFALEEPDGELSAFLSLTPHFPHAWELHCMAVRASRRQRGLGTAILAQAEAWLLAQGVRYLQVKTVADTSPSVEYAQTRAFYQARGFEPLEVFPTLWDAHNPALQLVKVLRAG